MRFLLVPVLFLAGCAGAQPAPEAPPSADLAFLAADAPRHFERVRGVADTTQAYGFGDQISSETLYRQPLAADSAREAIVTVTTAPDGSVTSSYRATFGRADLPYREREAYNAPIRDALVDSIAAALPAWELDGSISSRLRIRECPGFYGRSIEVATGSDGVRLEIRSGDQTCTPEADRALLTAAASGDTAAITAALDAGAAIDASGDETGLYSGSALHVAAREDREGAVRLLLARGANPNATDPEGFTPLNLASAAITRLLLEAGASVDVTQDFANRAPVPNAAIDDDLDKLRLLLDAGADPDAQMPVLNNQGALHFAVTNASPEAVRLLLASGASPDLPDALGYTPLLNAVSGATDAETGIEIARMLLDAGADINQPSNQHNSYAWTPLMEAARNGQAAVVRFLLGVDGIDLGARSTEDMTALGAARDGGHSEVVALLENAGVPE